MTIITRKLEFMGFFILAQIHFTHGLALSKIQVPYSLLLWSGGVVDLSCGHVEWWSCGVVGWWSEGPIDYYIGLVHYFIV